MARPRKQKHICKFCLSPFREQIEREVDLKIPRDIIYDKYSILMSHPFATRDSFKGGLIYHLAHTNQRGGTTLQRTMKKLEGVDIQTLLEKLLILANAKVENMSPKELKLNEVFQGQKVILEIKKQKMHEDAVHLMLAKLFGPKLIEKEKAQEGEVVKYGHGLAGYFPTQPKNP